MVLDESDYTVEDRGFATPCWIAKTRKGNDRYALTRIDGKEIYVHRAMYEQEIGPIPTGMHLDHLCTMTRCMRPEHLEPVTPAENTRRSRATKLTKDQVRRARYGSENVRALATEFGVTIFLIYQIRQGKVWKGV